MAVKFWYVEGACSLAVRICLNEVGVSFEGVRTVIGEGGTYSEEFGRLNPKRRVPVLSIDDDVVTELPAIFTAVSLLSPQYKLMGSSNLEIARTYEWLAWLTGTLHGLGFGALWRPARFSDDAAALESVSLKGRKTVQECYVDIEARLSGQYSVGEQFTSVDALLLVYFTWGNMIGIDMMQYPRYTRFADTISKRPAVVKALEFERVSLNGPQDLPDLSK